MLGDRTHVAQEEAERVGLFSLENRKIKEDLAENFNCMKESYKEHGPRFFTVTCMRQ